MWFLAILLAIAFYIYRYYKGRQDYWKNRGIASPPSSFFTGHLLDLININRPHGLVIKEWGKKYGKVFGILEGSRPMLVLSDPAMLQEMFIKKFEDFYARKDSILVDDVENDPRVTLFRSQGVRWKRLRTICSSSFSSNSLRKIMDTVDDSALELMRHFEPHVDGEPIDVHKFYQEYTMDVISRVAMGQPESKMFNNPTLPLVNLFFQQDMQNVYFILGNSVPILRPLMKRLYAKISQAQVTAAKPIFATIYKTLDERIAQRERDAADGMEPGEPQDFIDLFLDARAEGDIDGGAEFSKSNLKVARNLTKEEIAAQCWLFLAAGYDTTSNTLSYCTRLLATHPEIQKKLQKEIDEVCGTDQEIGYDAQSKLKYTEAVIKESLRMYPLANGASSRTAMKDTTLGDIHIEKGTVIQADVQSLHYDKEIWGEDADEFVPERWEDEKIKHTSAWIPFGSGPRVCLGMRLAYMEAKVALAQLLRRFDFVIGPKSEKELNLVGSTTMSPASVTIYLKTRASA